MKKPVHVSGIIIVALGCVGEGGTFIDSIVGFPLKKTIYIFNFAKKFIYLERVLLLSLKIMNPPTDRTSQDVFKEILDMGILEVEIQQLHQGLEALRVHWEDPAVFLPQRFCSRATFSEQMHAYEEALAKHEDMIAREREQIRSHLEYMQECQKTNKDSVTQSNKRKDLITPCKQRIASHLKNMGNIRSAILDLLDKIIVDPREFYSILKPKVEEWTALKMNEQDKRSNTWYLQHGKASKAATADLLDEVFFEVDDDSI